ncbi:lysine biosynthesis protein LysW [Candidatus Shapirobacteria bacterium CG03_land_8_20_14_0_80_39_12]|uniref:Lysine biosynthesis protein LysW n=1 Tax=Candidatus Shapirobacteria bacterium CG03_land_8_20_14_0_80_39_12 TaxID=1974879 RepID=A0A2M7BDU4_9BACT|nr:MAG: lysine biosynthesis protein LysW [Candidatus Shapirobacteria bacterium CG03_land_8_20_14_0_80_39_12]
MTKTIKCPDCEKVIIVPDDAQVGEIIECSNCGNEFEIISLNPLQTAVVIEEKG